MSSISKEENAQIDRAIGLSSGYKGPSAQSLNPAKPSLFKRGVGAFSRFISRSGKQIDKATDKVLEAASLTQEEAEKLNKQVPHVRSYGEKLKLLGAIGVAVGNKDAVKVFEAGQRLENLKEPVKSRADLLESGVGKSQQAKEDEEARKKKKEEEDRRRRNSNRSRNRGGGKKDLKQL